MAYEIEAWDGSSRYLFSDDDQGRVVDTARSWVGPPFDLQSIYSRGGWEDPPRDISAAEQLLREHVEQEGG